MRLFAVGLSHRTAPVELRERVDFARGGVDAALAALAARGVGPRDRSCSRPATAPRSTRPATRTRPRTGIGRFFSEYHGVAHDADRRASLRPARRRRRAAPVPRRRRPRFARRRRAADPRPGQGGLHASPATGSYTGALHNRLFHSAFAAGKRVRSETGLGEGAVSVSYAAIALARKIFGDLYGLQVLILGAGEMAKLTGVHLQAQQVQRITIASRTLATAAEPRRAARRRRPCPGRDSTTRWPPPTSSSPRPARPNRVLTRARVEEVMRPRRNRPLFIIDIAVPRDVEPAVGQPRSGVPLQHRRPAGRSSRRTWRGAARELARAEAIVDEEVARFAAWLQSREIIPTVVALRQRFEAIRQAELPRLEPKLAGLPPEARARVDEITRLIVEKLLLTPTEQLKAVSDESHGRRLRRRAEPAVQPRAEDQTGRRRAGRRRVRGAVVTALRLGTRGSPLALWQARTVASAARRPRASRVELVVITTSGDRLQDAPLSASGRQAAVRQGDRGCAAARRDRPRGAQRQGHAGGAARRPRRSPRRCRAKIRATRWCCRDGSRTQDFAGALAHLGDDAVDRHRAASGASRSCAALSAARRSRRFAATSTRACASSTPASYDALVLAARRAAPARRWRRASRPPSRSTSACRRRARASSRSRSARTTSARAALVAPLNDAAAAASLAAERALVDGARRRLPAAARRDCACTIARHSTCTRSSRRSTAVA